MRFPSFLKVEDSFGAKLTTVKLSSGSQQTVKLGLKLVLDCLIESVDGVEAAVLIRN